MGKVRVVLELEEKNLPAIRVLFSNAGEDGEIEPMARIVSGPEPVPEVVPMVCKHTGEEGCREHNLHCGFPKCQVPRSEYKS
jgi:hypothetical protein